MVAVHMVKTYASKALQHKYLPMLTKSMVIKHDKFWTVYAKILALIL